MRVFVRCLFIACVLAGCGDGEQGPPDEAECARLRTHLIEVRMQDVTTEVAQHRQALEQALRDSFVPACTKGVARAQWDCAMAATSASSLAACNVVDE